MILLELPSEDILFAQQVSRQFRSVITGLNPLQVRLFLAAQPDISIPKNIILNPMIIQKQTLPCIPLYFDERKESLAYCHREHRKRVYCKTVAVQQDGMTGQEWLELHLTDKSPWMFDEESRAPFGAGSWKQMCLSQPPCEVKWHLTIKKDDHMEHRYSGTVAGQSTMDALLEALAAGIVVDEGEHRHARRW
jgi:hypothetical protein